MQRLLSQLGIVASLAFASSLFAEKPLSEKALEFPPELVEFGPASEKPLFSGTDSQHWDKLIRERGWILREEDRWHLWYTGYNEELTKDRYLGYATSPDGLNWTRWSGNPLTKEGWVEDMCVVKQGDTYYMFAEGRGDIAQLLTSKDRVNWQNQGDLDIRQTNGQPISSGPRGTPTAWFENGTWWLFYERKDLAVYVATSKDMQQWTNVIDEPCIALGPNDYDRYAVAVDQIVKVDDRYFAYYHASALPNWGEWTTCIAMSEDLVHWTKYSKNPILPVNQASKSASSGTIVHDGQAWRLYTTHPDIRVYFPKQPAPSK